MSRNNPSHHPRHRAYHNKTLPCGVSNCPRLRWAVSQYCHPHASASLKYGSPLGRKLPLDRVRPYQELAAKWIAAFRDHDTIRAAVETVEQIVLTPEPESLRKPLKFNARYQLRQEQLRLLNPPPRYQKGRGNAGKLYEIQAEPLGPEEALSIILGTWAVVYYFPELLPDDADALTFALADQLFRSRQYTPLRAWSSFNRSELIHVKIPGALARRRLGKRIRDELATGAFLTHAVENMEAWYAAEMKKAEEKKARLGRRVE